RCYRDWSSDVCSSDLTVRQSPWSKPASSNIFMRGGSPPIRTKWDMPYLPEGFKSARTGTFLPTRVKSSIESLTSAAWAIASRWRSEERRVGKEDEHWV